MPAGVTIVATIHSPTAYSFSLFDSLMMLVSAFLLPAWAPHHRPSTYTQDSLLCVYVTMKLSFLHWLTANRSRVISVAFGPAGHTLQVSIHQTQL